MHEVVKHDGRVQIWALIENPHLDFLKLHGSIMSFGYTKKFNQYVKVHMQKSVHTITQKRVTANGQKCL